jgi:short-subunit dehydrogenase
MVGRRRGAIINLSSSSGFVPSPYNASNAAAKAHTLLLSEAVNEEVSPFGVTVTAVCPGPVPTEFIAVNDAVIAGRVPKILHVSPERVVADALRAVERGKRTVVPGSPLVKAFFGSGRLTPSPITLQITKRLLVR